MADDQQPDDHKQDTPDTGQADLLGGEIHASEKASPEIAYKKNDASKENKALVKKAIIGRLLSLETINAVSTVVMAVAAVATLFVASNTQDIQRAIVTISDLAQQAKRQADATQRLLEIQQQELGLSHRPRIIVRPVSTTMFNVTDTDFWWEFTLSFRNVGNLPAIGISYSASTVDSLTAKPTRQAELCQEADTLGAGVSNGKPYTLPQRPDLPEGAEVNMSFSGTTPIKKTTDLNIYRFEAGSGISAVFMGCVSYMTPGENSRHHTWFSFVIREVGSNGRAVAPSIVPHIADVKTIRMEQDFLGGNGED